MGIGRVDVGGRIGAVCAGRVVGDGADGRGGEVIGSVWSDKGRAKVAKSARVIAGTGERVVTRRRCRGVNSCES